MSVHPKAYRQRLLNALVAVDIHLLMNRINGYNHGMDLIDIRYWLIDNWNETIQKEVFKILTDRLKNDLS